MSRLVENIKESEGFVAAPYLDSLGYSTVGIGTRLPLTVAEIEIVIRFRFDEAMKKINSDGVVFNGDIFPLSKQEATILLEFRLNQKISHLLEKKPIVLRLPQEQQEVVFEMVYQMGVNGVLNFKMMWLALEQLDYGIASVEMLDSRWAKQTPQRAEKLAKKMSGIA